MGDVIEEIVKGVAIGGAIVVGAAVAFWAANKLIKKWKIEYRDKITAWLRNHPNETISSVGLKLAVGFELAVAARDNIAAKIFGKKANGGEVEIETATMTLEEFEKVKKRLVAADGAAQEIELFTEAELAELCA